MVPPFSARGGAGSRGRRRGRAATGPLNRDLALPTAMVRSTGNRRPPTGRRVPRRAARRGSRRQGRRRRAPRAPCAYPSASSRPVVSVIAVRNRTAVSPAPPVSSSTAAYGAARRANAPARNALPKANASTARTKSRSPIEATNPARAAAKRPPRTRGSGGTAIVHPFGSRRYHRPAFIVAGSRDSSRAAGSTYPYERRSFLRHQRYIQTLRKVLGAGGGRDQDVCPLEPGHAQDRRRGRWLPGGLERGARRHPARPSQPRPDRPCGSRPDDPGVLAPSGCGPRTDPAYARGRGVVHVAGPEDRGRGGARAPPHVAEGPPPRG